MKARVMVVLCIAGLVACMNEMPAPPKSGPTVVLGTAEQERFAPRDYGAAAAGFQTVDLRSNSATQRIPHIAMDSAAANMIIRTAQAYIEVDSLDIAVSRVRQLAARVGGFVANVGMQTGSGQLRQATLELKIPAHRFDEAVGGLSPIGKLESVNVSAADVGEEYFDVMARIENGRRLERRLIDLLATRTGKLKDVLDVEHEMARVREEIERYEGRIRFLRSHVSVSTLTVSVHEPLPVVGSAGQSVMGEAFRQAWRNFVALAALAVQSLGVVIPLVALALIGWIVARRWRKLSGQRVA